MRKERGAAMVETLMCIMFLCLVLFGLLHVFDWIKAGMLYDYASFYAAKSWSLGYTPAITRRAARVAAIGASGRDLSVQKVSARNYDSKYEARKVLARRAEDYMQYGRAGTMGVNFEYWGEQDKDYVADDGTDAYLQISTSTNGNMIRASTILYNALYFDYGALKNTRHTVGNVSERGVEMVNHSRHYLQSDGYREVANAQ